MAEIKLFYPGFLKKAATFSYDDGTFYDVFLTRILNRFGLKGTFNLNSGLFGVNACIDFGDQIIYHNRLSEEQVRTVYAGHELAAHSLTHPLLTGQTREFLDGEVLTDLANLERIAGEEIVGFAYPGGPHDEHSDAYLRDKVLYARTIESSHSFEVPESFVPLSPTVFHMEPEFLPLCGRFAESSPEEISWLYIWGHSYEFSLGDTYRNFLEACELLSSREDIWFATNREIIGYVLCGRSLRLEGGKLVNDSDTDVYAEVGGRRVVVAARSRARIG